MAHGSWLKGARRGGLTGGWVAGRGPGWAPLSHEPLTSDHRSIKKIFEHILCVLGIRHQPRIPFKVLRFPDSKLNI